MLSTCVSRPRLYQTFYQAKLKHFDILKRPSWASESAGLLGWIHPVIRTKEPELIAEIGIEAAAYLRFLRMMRTIFAFVALLTCGILIPINVTYWFSYVQSIDDDFLSILTIRDVGGNYLLVHVGMVYIITAVVIVVIWSNLSEMLRLRAQFFRSLESSDAVLIVMHVPEKFQSDEDIRTLLESVGSVQRYMAAADIRVGRRLGDPPSLIKDHNDSVREFEAVLVKYLKALKGRKTGNKPRPTIRLGGFLGMGGKVEDAIDHYTCVFCHVIMPQRLTVSFSE
jgi:hypothetical protein